MSDNDRPGGSNGSGGDNNGGNPWLKSLLIWVGILFALALVVTVFDGRSTTATGNMIAYSTFLDKVDEGTVKDVNVSRDIIRGTFSSGDKFRTYPVQDSGLMDRLRKAGSD